MDDIGPLLAASPDEQRGEVGRMRRRSKQHDASFIGSASGIHFVQSVYASLGKTTANSGNSQSSVDHDIVPGEEDRQQTSGAHRDGHRLWAPTELAISSAHSDHYITFDDLLAWSQNFFEYWHPALPFLHAPAFLQWCEKIAQHPLTELDRHINANQTATIRSIMSISLADSRQSGAARLRSKVPSVLVFHAFSDALDAIQGLLVATPTIESLQTAVSVQVFLVSMLRHNAASRLGGVIVRAAFQMGLHRCPERFATFSHEECDMRRRLFWSIYCLDRYICQSLGSPITLCDSDIDVCHPNEERHLAKPGGHRGMCPPHLMQDMPSK